MQKIGIIEDLDDSFNDYKEILQEEEIDLIRIESFSNISELHKFILDNNIEAMIIDYKLKPKFNFLGTEIISELNKLMPDFTCFILTVYPDESIEEELVSSNSIYDKKRVTIPGKNEYESFVSDIKHAANVYKKRKELLVEEYRNLLDSNKESEKLTAKIKDEIKEKYKLLSNYGIVEAIPSEMLENEAQEKMSELIDKINELINKK